MKIAFTNPNYWPYIRRGAERYIHDMAGFLAQRGHQVHVITSTPGQPHTVEQDGVKILYLRQVRHPLLNNLRMIRHDFFGWTAYPLLRSGGYDVIDTMTYFCALAALRARRYSGTPFQFRVLMVPLCGGRFWDPPAVSTAVARADRTVAFSRWSAEWIEHTYHVPCNVLYSIVDLNRFRPGARRDLTVPRILFASDLRDPKKGGGLLFMAFEQVHRLCPQAVLELAGPGGDQPGNLLELLSPSARHRVVPLGAGAHVDIAQLYPQAAVTVLPTLQEPFGMVLAESLACGTPVVGTRQGGASEIVGNAPVGRLIDLRDWHEILSPRAANHLAMAIMEAIDLAADPETARLCRQRASRFSLDVLGPELEESYSQLVRQGTSTVRSQRSASAVVHQR